MSRRQTPTGDPTLPPIHTVRGRRIVLDSDLAALYGVPTRRLNEAVKRNLERFPDEFRFQLTKEEHGNLKSQSVISSPQATDPQSFAPNRSQIATGSSRHRDPRFLPFAFTEHGALMAATVLNSPRAVEMSLFIVRAFVRMREELLTNAVVLKRLAQIDKKLLEHDLVLRDVVEKLLPLLNAPPEPEPPRRRISFGANED
jgi:hypothetical protein